MAWLAPHSGVLSLKAGSAFSIDPLGQTTLTKNAKLEEVISFLKSEFPDFTINRSDVREMETVLELTSGRKRHILRLRHELLNSTPIEDIPARLSGFRLVQTLRDMEDFPIIVSANGCVVGW